MVIVVMLMMVRHCLLLLLLLIKMVFGGKLGCEVLLFSLLQLLGSHLEVMVLPEQAQSPI